MHKTDKLKKANPKGMHDALLEQINDNVTALRKEVGELRRLIDEPELADDVKRSVRQSRRRHPDTFLSQEDVEKQFP